MGFLKETELEEASIPFLEEMGLNYKWRVPLYNRVVDLAAIDKDGNLIGIEYKLKDWKRAIGQALININSFDFIYICVPAGKYLTKIIEEARKHGIGVLAYNFDIKNILEELTAKKITQQWYPNKELIRNYLTDRGTN